LAGDEHRQRSDERVAGELQHRLGRGGVELAVDGEEGRVHQADANEGRRRGEGDRPRGLGLAERVAARGGGGSVRGGGGGGLLGRRGARRVAARGLRGAGRTGGRRGIGEG